MTEPTGRQMFRFRLPWMFNTAPTPISAPAEPQAATQRATRTIPIQRPLGTPTAPTQPRNEPKLPTTPPQSRVPPRPPSSQAPSQSQTAPTQPAAPPARTEPKPPSTPSQSRMSPTPPPSSQSRSQTSPARPLAAAAQLPPPSQTAPQPRAPSQPPSPSQTTTPSQPKSSSPKTESKPSSPSKTTNPSQPKTPPRTESSKPPSSPSPPSRVASQPPSPSQTPSKPPPPPKQSVLQQPSAPSPTTNQRPIASSRVSSKPQYPPRLASQPAARTSPSRTPSQEAALRPASSQTSSPSKQKVPQSRTKTQASSQAPSPSKSSVSQPESPSSKTAKAEAALSQPLATEPQPRAQISSVPASQTQHQTQATSEQDKTKLPLVLTPPAVSAPMPPEEPVKQPSKSFPVPIDPNNPKFETETKEKPKTESSTQEDKLVNAVDNEPKQNRSTELPNMATGSNTSRAKQNMPEKQAHGDDKDMAQESKTSFPIPQKGMNVSSEPHSRPSVPPVERASLHKEIKDDISRFVHKLGSGHPMEPTGEPVSVITLTGENRGAFMHVGAEVERKEGSVHIHRGYKLNQDDNNEVTTDGESSSKGRKSSNSPSKDNTERMAYINSNIQSINNSIMFKSSISERNPGVKMVLRRNQIEPVKTNGKEKSVEAHKADFNVTQPQKLTYEPNIRRRCLRGLFLEPSDSDPDKPRRHGCRYSCEEKKKCNEMF